MLTHLDIRDLAVIAAVEIDLRSGLTVLTGETGAGKSIIVDALQLATGGRGGTELVRHGAERAEVSATFDLPAAHAELAALLEEQSIAADGELVLRRVITRDGKSRGYLNGQQVPLQVLRVAGSLLLDIHGQHEFQSLIKSNEQRALLDRFGGALELAERVAVAHRQARALEAELSELAERARDRDARLELLRHQHRELSALNCSASEYADLLEERTRLSHRGKLAEAGQGALTALYEADSGSAHAMAGRALSLLKGAASLDPSLADVAATVDEAVIRTREAARALSGYLQSLDVDPARQELLEQRLATLEDLARKHRVTPAQLSQKFGELGAELQQLEQVEAGLQQLRAQVAQATQSWQTIAAELSARRRETAATLGRDITARMQTLGMNGGRFEIRLSATQRSTPTATTAFGLDDIEFDVSANPGQPLRPLAKVASGGELSRLSLAVQVAIAAADASASDSKLACMVFDEVDAGVGGAVAEIVGRELAALGASAQVLCVTHLPQVAAQAAQQLRVAKLSDGKTTRTSVASLTAAERVEEIARMLGGVQVSDTAREHAREMLSQRSTAASDAKRSGKRAGAARGRGS